MDIYRTFKVDTRSIVSNDRKYAGVVCDSESTTIHFTYSPLDFLSADGKDRWIPWIIFNVHYTKDDLVRYPEADIEVGRPMQYSLNSTPPFNGLDFDIPWDVTRKVDTNRLEYQLLFVKASVKYDGRGIAQLDRTQYLLSPLDSIALKPSIRCNGKSSSCGTPPYTEPSVQGMLELFKEHAVLNPVDTRYDKEKDRTELVFNTYYGNHDSSVVLDFVPLGKDSKVDARYLNLITEWGTQSDENMATANLVKDSLDAKTDIVMAIPRWDEDIEFGLGSVVSVKDNLYMSKQDANAGNPVSDQDWWVCLTAYEENTINDWALARDDNLPSAKLVSDSLDLKADKTQIVNEWGEGSEEKAPSTMLALKALDTKLGKTQLADAWSEVPDDDTIPSQKLVKDALDSKTDSNMAVPLWNAETEYRKGSTVIFENQLYISCADRNTGNNPLISEELWAQVRGNGSGDSRETFSKTIQAGEHRSTIIHGLDNENVFVTLRSMAEPREYLYGDITIVDKDTVSVEFSDPLENDVLVLIATGAQETVAKEIPGGTSKREFYISHNYGTYNLFVQVRRKDDGRIVDVGVNAVDPAGVKVTFSTPPESDYIVIVSPYAGEITEGAKVFPFNDEPRNVWKVVHNLGRIAQVQTFDENGIEIEGVVNWNFYDSLNSVTIYFSEPVIGWAVIR